MYLSVNAEQEMKESYPTGSVNVLWILVVQGQLQTSSCCLRAFSTLGKFVVLTDDNRLSAFLPYPIQ